MSALWAGAAYAVPDYSTQAAELARLRSEVETLDRAIEDKNEDTRGRLRALGQQKATLEAEIQREDMRLKQIELSIEKVQAQVREAGELQRSMKPAVLQAIGAVRGSVENGLPFRREDRMAELKKLEGELDQDVVLPAVAISRLWSFVEDELRLTRENGMYQQVIKLHGEEILADVARVGMVMLYFRTPDGRYGYAVRDSDDWRYTRIDDENDKRRVESLFESLEKRVRVGFFELPNATTAMKEPTR